MADGSAGRDRARSRPCPRLVAAEVSSHAATILHAPLLAAIVRRTHLATPPDGSASLGCEAMVAGGQQPLVRVDAEDRRLRPRTVARVPRSRRHVIDPLSAVTSCRGQARGRLDGCARHAIRKDTGPAGRQSHSLRRPGRVATGLAPAVTLRAQLARARPVAARPLRTALHLERLVRWRRDRGSTSGAGAGWTDRAAPSAGPRRAGVGIAALDRVRDRHARSTSPGASLGRPGSLAGRGPSTGLPAPVWTHLPFYLARRRADPVCSERTSAGSRRQQRWHVGPPMAPGTRGWRDAARPAARSSDSEVSVPRRSSWRASATGSCGPARGRAPRPPSRAPELRRRCWASGHLPQSDNPAALRGDQRRMARELDHRPPEVAAPHGGPTGPTRP